MYYKKDIENTKVLFEKWWKRENERPLLWIVAKKGKYCDRYKTVELRSDQDMYLDYEGLTNNYLNYLENHDYLCESYPNISGDLGAGSVALYIGATPVFSKETVWFKEVLNDTEKNFVIKTDYENKWFKKHLDLVKNLRKLSLGRYFINIPDLVENIDIYSALRGPQNTCFDIIDEPEYVKGKIKEIEKIYLDYYNAFYKIVEIDGYSSYTAFKILGKGKVAKIQCDFSAMMSPDQYREFVVPSMTKQLNSFDKSIYHLDGKDALKHLDTIMDYEKLDALQWTPGANHSDGANDRWYDIYDKVKAADKSLWVAVYDGDVNDWIRATKKMINRYGKSGLYFLYPEMVLEEAERIIDTINVQ